jgi:hypothetical protein
MKIRAGVLVVLVAVVVAVAGAAVPAGASKPAERNIRVSWAEDSPMVIRIAVPKGKVLSVLRCAHYAVGESQGSTVSWAKWSQKQCGSSPAPRRVTVKLRTVSHGGDEVVTDTYTLFVRVWGSHGKHSTMWRCDNPTNYATVLNGTRRVGWKGTCKATFHT